jgi:hypothetical protein
MFGEAVLLIGLAAIAYFLWVQQSQLVELELELDKLRGVFPPVPVADGTAAVEKAAPRPRRPKAAPDA